jgi:hypothetical protein
MSYAFVARLHGQFEVAEVGTNGAQRPMLALWLAAYGATGRPDSRRVRARWFDVIPGAPDGLWSFDETIAHTRRLIACNEGDQSWITVSSRNDFSIQRGLKLKPVTDPPLVALVDYWRVFWSDSQDRELGVDLTARLAETFCLLLPELEPSAWHPKLARVAHLFEAAAAAGVSVSHG